jgi:probable rRNA maturation factor
VVEILDETSRYPKRQAKALAAALERLMAHYGAKGRLVTVVLVDDARIRAMNREHRGVDAATDVLSYPLQEPDDVGIPPVPHLGDIIISLEAAERQAEGRNAPPFDEVAVLAAHGLMHLLGYDHPTEDAWQEFENAQQLILTFATRP